MLRGLVVGLKTLLLFMLLYTSPAHGQQMEDAAIQKYIKILELEIFSFGYCCKRYLFGVVAIRKEYVYSTHC